MAESSQSFLDRHYFLLRRLHSLSGVVPIGAFLIMHLTTNSSVLWGAFNSRAEGTGAIGRGIGTFIHEVLFINELPALLLTEIFVLWLPILFHAVLGVYYATTGKRNTERYAYQDNWRYTLQRWTGYIGFAFILYHVATLRWGWSWLVPGGAEWSHYYAASTLGAALRGSPDGWTFGGVIVSLFYMLGVTSLVFHFANGLWTAAITWGLTVSASAQRRWGYVCAAVGIGLLGAGWSALAGFTLLVDHAEARRIEERMVVEKYGQEKLDELREKYGISEDSDLAGAARDEVRRLAAWPYPGPAPEVRSPQGAGPGAGIGSGPANE